MEFVTRCNLSPVHVRPGLRAATFSYAGPLAGGDLLATLVGLAFHVACLGGGLDLGGFK